MIYSFGLLLILHLLWHIGFILVRRLDVKLSEQVLEKLEAMSDEEFAEVELKAAE